MSEDFWRLCRQYIQRVDRHGGGTTRSVVPLDAFRATAASCFRLLPESTWFREAGSPSTPWKIRDSVIGPGPQSGGLGTPVPGMQQADHQERAPLDGRPARAAAHRE
jgi:hypothetical protein